MTDVWRKMSEEFLESDNSTRLSPATPRRNAIDAATAGLTDAQHFEVLHKAFGELERELAAITTKLKRIEDGQRDLHACRNELIEAQHDRAAMQAQRDEAQREVEALKAAMSAGLLTVKQQRDEAMEALKLCVKERGHMNWCEVVYHDMPTEYCNCGLDDYEDKIAKLEARDAR